jgi:hypothetical protein
MFQQFKAGFGLVLGVAAGFAVVIKVSEWVAEAVSESKE